MEQRQRMIVHPDENLLAAFAERTLAPGERERVMAHLADCGDCRDVVFLAQQAVPELELQAGLRFGQSLPRALRWRWAIVSTAGVLAAVLIAAPVVFYRHAENAARSSPPQTVASGRSSGQSAAVAVPSAPPAQRQPQANASGFLPGRRAGAARNESDARSSGVAASAQAAPKPVAAVSAEWPAALPQISLTPGGQVAGSVSDPSGAAIPGATVSLRSSDASTRRVVTDPAGRFEIGAVPPGNYVAEFSAPGFQSAVRDVDVPAQPHAALAQTLAPGAVSETVSVSAASAQLETENPQPQNTIINGKEVDPLLLQGRNVTRLGPVSSSQPAQAFAGVAGARASGVAGGLIRPTASLAIKNGSLQSCVGATCAMRALPSGKQAVSVAFDRRTSLVVDADGNVFSTSDAGAHWVAIKNQWDGKAIALKLAAPPSDSAKESIGGPVATGPTAGTIGAPLIFTLTNDKGQVWLSPDEGQTWRLQ